jgi:two-component system, chemotaxis family, protein-glutamate methylesterase/glutaminase
MTRPLSVLIVDDSEVSRRALRGAIQTEAALEVVGEARTGEEALELARKLKPSLITMDIQMPGMGGLKAIELLLKERPVPVVVISERSSSASIDLNYEAISRGALELISKGALFERRGLQQFAQHLRSLAEGYWLKTLPLTSKSPLPQPLADHRDAPILLGIGASTGGPRALAKLLRALPRNYPLPIAIVQHMAEDFFDSFVRFLGDASGLKVQLVESQQTLLPGHVYVGPSKFEFFVKEDLTAKLSPSPPNAFFSPSVDSLFFSMANALKAKSIGVLLTGMGDDGAEGLLKLRRVGAHTIVQNRESSAVWGMPHAAFQLGAAEHVQSLEEISTTLVALTKPAPHAPSGSKRSEKPVSEKKRALKILVVDDDVIFLEVTRSLLAAQGYEVEAISNPMLLASRLIRAPVDVVVLESELTTVDTPSLLVTLRKRNLARGPLILFSRLPAASLQQRQKACAAVEAFEKHNSAALLGALSALQPQT